MTISSNFADSDNAELHTSVGRRLRLAFQALTLITILTVIVALAGTWFAYREEIVRSKASAQAVTMLYDAESSFLQLTSLKPPPGFARAPDHLDPYQRRFNLAIDEFKVQLSALHEQSLIEDRAIDQFLVSVVDLQVRHDEQVALLYRIGSLQERSENGLATTRDVIAEAITTGRELETDLNLAIVDRLPAHLDAAPQSLDANLAALRRITLLTANFNTLTDRIGNALEQTDENALRQMMVGMELSLTSMTAMALALPDNDQRVTIARAIRSVREELIADDGLIASRVELGQLEGELAANDEAITALNETIRTTLDEVFETMANDAEATSAQAYKVIVVTALALIALAALAIMFASISIWRLVLGDISARLDNLWRQTAAIAQGRLDEPVVVGGRDELTALGQQIEQSRLQTKKLIEADHLLRIGAERLSIAASTGKLGIFDWTDRRVDLAYYSAELAGMLGGDAVATTASSTWLMERLHPEDREVLGERLRMLVAEGDQEPILGRLRRDDDTWRWYDIALRRQTNAANAVERITIALHDVDEIVEARERLRRQTEDLTRINEELDRFAYVASHDLKSPLRAIADLAGWLEEDLDAVMDDDSRESMRLLSNRADRLIKLLDDLLTFSRVGRQDGQAQPVDIRALIEDAFTLAAGNKQFELVIEGDLPVLLTEATPLHQVFFNLMTNSIKHHDDSHGRIDVRYWHEDELHWFAVEDDGPGIEPRYHDRIFGMFTTLRPRDDVEGSGIGLAIIKKQVRLFGGTVRVESDPASGRGTRFTFSWRAKVTDQPATEPTTSPANALT